MQKILWIVLQLVLGKEFSWLPYLALDNQSTDSFFSSCSVTVGEECTVSDCTPCPHVVVVVKMC